jgi:hypothetical protein
LILVLPPSTLCQEKSLSLLIFSEPNPNPGAAACKKGEKNRDLNVQIGGRLCGLLRERGFGGWLLPFAGWRRKGFIRGCSQKGIIKDVILNGAKRSEEPLFTILILTTLLV